MGVLRHCNNFAVSLSRLSLSGGQKVLGRGGKASNFSHLTAVWKRSFIQPAPPAVHCGRIFQLQRIVGKAMDPLITTDKSMGALTNADPRSHSG
ncbi:hypothetical protein GJAV_G00066320 [Gymnothorax javanicus]|nr:hypothetical protein GJAV_G00066320 [Gymnothorax javanicus]